MPVTDAMIEAGAKAWREFDPGQRFLAEDYFTAIYRAMSQAAPQPTADQVERVARAIEGPHLPVREGSKFSLDHLREVRWSRLSEQERGVRCAEARAAIAALHARPGSGPAEGWREIASAPKDGTYFLAWNGNWRGLARYWQPNYEGDPEWVDETTAFIEPGVTHWMPLPNPPVTPTGKE